MMQNAKLQTDTLSLSSNFCYTNFEQGCASSHKTVTYKCNQRAKRKWLGRSGAFMAEWFRRWTLESATRIPANTTVKPIV